MIFPLETLIKYEGNMYEITCAAARRAFQLSMIGDSEVAENDDKPVSLAAHQIFGGEIDYRMDSLSGAARQPA